jgi:ribose transport system ATP-binding protein
MVNSHSNSVTQPVLVAEGISKSYGATRALKRVDLECRPGEVHALLGANGAGKSTLVRILSGVIAPDEGRLSLHGKEARFANPSHAGQLGVATVFQELSLFTKLTVAQNIYIGLGADHISVKATVGDLSLSEKQLVEIAKALSHQPDVILFDEATSALGPREASGIFQIIGSLRDEGKSIIFISHRMEEIRRLADRLTVLRDGEIVGRFEMTDFDHDRVLRSMLGERLASETFRRRLKPSPGKPVDNGAPVLETNQLSFKPAFTRLSLRILPGEVVGIAGLEGHGQIEFLHALFGLYRRGVTGQILVDGQEYRPTSPWAAVKRGLALVPEDRKSQGLFLRLAVSFNLSFTVLGQLSRLGGWLSQKQEKILTEDYLQKLHVKSASSRVAVGSLSGGNQQKVLVGKWMARDPKVIMFCDPSRGVDVGAKDQLHHAMHELAEQGKAVLLYSTELEELVAVADRVVVLFEGTIAGELQGESLTPANLLKLFFAGNPPEEVVA